MTNIKRLTKKLDDKKITPQEFRDRVDMYKNKPEFWNPALERHKKYRKGDEDSRVGFEFNPYANIKGMLHQWITKGAMRGFIDWAYDTPLKKYSETFYTYHDDRLLRMSKIFDDFIAEDFQEGHGYKTTMFNKVKHIILGIMKEDIYYRARFLKLLNVLATDIAKNGEYELTIDEKDNIERFH